MTPFTDPLATQIDPAAQLRMARMVQDAFAQTFKQTLELDETQRRNGIAASCHKLLDACSGVGETAPLHHAMTVSGLDQWGLAYSQAFGAEALAGITELLAALKYALARDKHEETCQSALKQLYASEEAAFTFKAELHKGIQLALWHAMIASEERASAEELLKLSGGRLLGLLNVMPGLGWIIVSSTLADIQIRCLAHGLAREGIALEMTQELLGALNQLPGEQRERILHHANQAVVAWHQTTRQPN